MPLSWCILLRQETMFQRVSFLLFFTCSLVGSQCLCMYLPYFSGRTTLSVLPTHSHITPAGKREIIKEREEKSLFSLKLCKDQLTNHVWKERRERDEKMTKRETMGISDTQWKTEHKHPSLHYLFPFTFLTAYQSRCLFSCEFGPLHEVSSYESLISLPSLHGVKSEEGLLWRRGRKRAVYEKPASDRRSMNVITMVAAERRTTSNVMAGDQAREWDEDDVKIRKERRDD